MNNKHSFSLEENLKSEQIQDDTTAWIPLLTQFGLKLINATTKETTLFHFQNEFILMDWNEYQIKIQEGQQQDLFFSVTGNEPMKVLILKGNGQFLTSIYNYCVGRYIFKKGTCFQTLKTLEEDEKFQLKIVQNQYNGKQYFEKILLLEESNQVQEMSFNSQKTYCQEKFIPEEIPIILELKRAQAQFIIPVESIFYDGKYFSYIYTKQKDIIEISKYCHNLKEEKPCFIVHIAKQLIKLLKILEEKMMIIPSLHHKNIYINTETLDIVLLNYSSAYYQQNSETERRCATFGYTPPEYFIQDQEITTKSNIYQAGVLLFYLLFDRTPYGKAFSDIVHNTLSKKPDYTPTKKDRSLLSNFIMLLLENDQNRRPSTQELLEHSLFKPQFLSLYSKFSIPKTEQNETIFSSTEEFNQFNRISNIQLIPKRTVKIKLQRIL